MESSVFFSSFSSHLTPSSSILFKAPFIPRWNGFLVCQTEVRDMNGAAISTLLSEGASQLSKIKYLGHN